MLPQKKDRNDAPTRRIEAALPEAQERKARVLTQGVPAMVRSIADAVVIKNKNLFLLTQPDGLVPLQGSHGLGLYYHDCRFLNGYEIALCGTAPTPLSADASRGYMALLQLTNQEIRGANGQLIRKEEVGIKWDRVIDPAERALHDAILFQNFTPEPIEFSISLRFSAAFEDIFAVRELLPEYPGTLFPPAWVDGVLHFVYEGSDRYFRGLSIHFSQSPEKREEAAAHFTIALASR